ncbi:hypothetical protein GGS20DRAFT_588205 [Poronia punctata]|nr:hypothetical protein GGS20DRAFT_588205 [Poronia punctata]
MTGTTKYTPEQIHFILDRTVREIPRGDTTRIHAQAVEDFRKAFGVEDFGLNQVRYVTDRYGTDPEYGNRAANLVRGRTGATPALLALNRNNIPDMLTASARRVLEKGNKSKSIICESCGGLGTIPLNRPRDDLGRRTSMPQLPRKQQQLETPRAIDHIAYRPQNHQQASNPMSSTEHFLTPSHHRRQSSGISQHRTGWSPHIHGHEDFPRLGPDSPQHVGYRVQPAPPNVPKHEPAQRVARTTPVVTARISPLNLHVAPGRTSTQRPHVGARNFVPQHEHSPLSRTIYPVTNSTVPPNINTPLRLPATHILQPRPLNNPQLQAFDYHPHLQVLEPPTKPLPLTPTINKHQRSPSVSSAINARSHNGELVSVGTNTHRANPDSMYAPGFHHTGNANGGNTAQEAPIPGSPEQQREAKRARFVSDANEDTDMRDISEDANGHEYGGNANANANANDNAGKEEQPLTDGVATAYTAPPVTTNTTLRTQTQDHNQVDNYDYTQPYAPVGEGVGMYTNDLVENQNQWGFVDPALLTFPMFPQMESGNVANDMDTPVERGTGGGTNYPQHSGFLPDAAKDNHNSAPYNLDSSAALIQARAPEEFFDSQLDQFDTSAGLINDNSLFTTPQPGLAGATPIAGQPTPSQPTPRQPSGYNTVNMATPISAGAAFKTAPTAGGWGQYMHRMTRQGRTSAGNFSVTSPPAQFHTQP